MLFFIITSFITASASIFLGMLVYTKNKKSAVNKLFGFYTLGVFIWSFFYGIWLLQDNSIDALFWSRMLNMGATLIPIAYLHWVLVFLKKNKEKKVILIFGYVITLIFLLFSFNSYYIKSVAPISFFPYWPQANWLYFLYLAFNYCGVVMYGSYLLYKGIKTTSGFYREQIKYAFMGSVIGFVGGATNFPLMLGIDLLPPIGNPFAIAFPLFFTYAIFKHHLFNIKVIATELLIFIIWIFVIIRFFLSETIQEKLINGGLLIFLIIFGILLIKSVLKEVKTREEMEELAKELEEANVRLKKLDEAKSEFITIASHQLRSPITAIKGYSSMMLEGSFGRVPVRAKKMLKRVLQSTNRLIFLIDDFLNLSQIERGKMQYNFEKTDLKEMVSGIVDEFKTIAVREKKDIEFVLEISETENFIATVDSNKIRQVFNNLIDNAIKYTEKGFVKINLYADDENERIFFEVLDSGIGMDEETEARIFQKFTRAGEDIFQVHTEGLGLGLYVSKEIIKAHNGKIYAKSDGPGKGSTFSVELPRGDIKPPNTSPEQDYQKHDKRLEEFIKKI